MTVAIVGSSSCSPPGEGGTDSGFGGRDGGAGDSAGVDGSGGSDSASVDHLVGQANPNDPDNATLDSDCDGLSDAEEVGNVYPSGRRTDPESPDSDGDGLFDAVAPEPLVPGGCGDSDGDTCDDCNSGTTPAPDKDGLDTDGDGLCDAGNGVNDGDEVAAGTSPTDPEDVSLFAGGVGPGDVTSGGSPAASEGCGCRSGAPGELGVVVLLAGALLRGRRRRSRSSF